MKIDNKKRQLSYFWSCFQSPFRLSFNFSSTSCKTVRLFIVQSLIIAWWCTCWNLIFSTAVADFHGIWIQMIVTDFLLHSRPQKRYIYKSDKSNPVSRAHNKKLQYARNIRIQSFANERVKRVRTIFPKPDWTMLWELSTIYSIFQPKIAHWSGKVEQ